MKNKANFFLITGVSQTGGGGSAWEFFPHNPVFFSDGVPQSNQSSLMFAFCFTSPFQETTFYGLGYSCINAQLSLACHLKMTRRRPRKFVEGKSRAPHVFKILPDFQIVAQFKFFWRISKILPIFKTLPNFQNTFKILTNFQNFGPFQKLH